MDTNVSKKQNASQKVIIFTDGSFNKHLKNMGGWAYIIYKSDSDIKTGSGYRTNTYPEEMELEAVVNALISLGNTKYDVDVYSDCRFVCSMADDVSMSKCLYGKRGVYVDVNIYANLLRLCSFHNVSFHWVKGHADNKPNNFVDRLAKEATREGYNKVFGGKRQVGTREKQISSKVL